MLQDGICSSSCRHTRSPGAAAGMALADRAYSCGSKGKHTSASGQQPELLLLSMDLETSTVLPTVAQLQRTPRQAGPKIVANSHGGLLQLS
jgi:hypothetical protein